MVVDDGVARTQDEGKEGEVRELLSAGIRTAGGRYLLVVAAYRLCRQIASCRLRAAGGATPEATCHQLAPSRLAYTTTDRLGAT